MKEISYKTHGLGVSGIVFEKHKAIWPVMHQFASFIERPGMPEFGRDQTSVALQHIASEKEIFPPDPRPEEPAEERSLVLLVIAHGYHRKLGAEV